MQATAWVRFAISARWSGVSGIGGVGVAGGDDGEAGGGEGCAQLAARARVMSFSRTLSPRVAPVIGAAVGRVEHDEVVVQLRSGPAGGCCAGMGIWVWTACLGLRVDGEGNRRRARQDGEEDGSGLAGRDQRVFIVERTCQRVRYEE